jgi:GNAT superfamily N-acetyltransferase
MRSGRRLLLVAMDGVSPVGQASWPVLLNVNATGQEACPTQPDQVQGSIQIDLEPRANGAHRAEVIKLFVHRRARRRGLARALMLEVQSTARRLGRTLLLMDTRSGSEAETLCQSLGYIRYGVVPAYARSPNGILDPTSFYYCQLA